MKKTDTEIIDWAIARSLSSPYPNPPADYINLLWRVLMHFSEEDAFYILSLGDDRIAHALCQITEPKLHDSVLEMRMVRLRVHTDWPSAITNFVRRHSSKRILTNS